MTFPRSPSGFGRALHALRVDRGAIAAEYGLLLVLIALAIVAAVTFFGGQVMRLLQSGAEAF